MNNTHGEGKEGPKACRSTPYSPKFLPSVPFSDPQHRPAKGVGTSDWDGNSRHHGFLLASTKGMDMGDQKVSAAVVKFSNVGFFYDDGYQCILESRSRC